jgi:hypothetical protein
MIPLNYDIRINPRVLQTGGSAFALNAVILVENALLPTNTLKQFANADDVGAYFDTTSEAYKMAAVYFKGPDISLSKPNTLYFYRYTPNDTAAYLRGGRVSGLTLAQLQALSGTLTLTVDATTATTASITLTGVASFSAAATAIQTAIRDTAISDSVTVTYSSLTGAFTITSPTTGDTSVVSFATGTLAAGLKLTAATGAVQSVGVDATSPTDMLNAIKNLSMNWASVMYSAAPSDADDLETAEWVNSQNKRFSYIHHDLTAAAKTDGNTTSFGYQIKSGSEEGIISVYGLNKVAAFVASIAASTDFTQTNGRPSFKFKSQAGLETSVSNATEASVLTTNGYNFYGEYDGPFEYYAEGSISGAFNWSDSYYNQIWLNARFQNTLATLLTSLQSAPYNEDGYNQLATALSDDIQAAINFGMIRRGVRPSSTQAAVVAAEAGLDISDALFANGYYLQVKDPGAPARQARTSPVINFWYMDGQSIHKINMNSTNLQ